MYVLHSGFLSSFALALKNRVCSEIFYFNIFIFQDFWATCSFAENRVCLEIFSVLNILFTFRIFEQLALALKNRVCPEFTVLTIHFLTFRNFEELALALKNRVCPALTVLNMYFLLFRILNKLRLPWKTEFALIIFLYLNIFQDFWATCACPENRVCLDFFRPGGAADPPPRTPLVALEYHVILISFFFVI